MSAISPKQYEDLQQKVKGADLFRTNEIAATFLIFTNRGLALPKEIRQKISAAMFQSVRKYKKNLNKYRAANNQVLIAGAFGSLNEEMLSRVEKGFDRAVDYSKIPQTKLSIDSDIRDSYRTKIWPDMDKNRSKHMDACPRQPRSFGQPNGDFGNRCSCNHQLHL
jgi:hypothetical protein